MPLDPDAETLLAMMRAAGRPPMETLSQDEARRSFAAGRTVTVAAATGGHVAAVEHFAVTGVRIGATG